MLLHPNWGKFKSFVTSWKEPEPAAQARGLPTSHDLALLGCYQWLSHPWESGLGIPGQLGLSPPGP